MSRPGVEVSSSAAAPPLGVPTDTSVYFCLGEAQMGPIDQPTRLISKNDFDRVYGARVAAAPYAGDGIEAYFNNGGGVAYFMRLVDGGTAATGDATAIAAANNVIATNPGSWGNDVELDVVATPGGTTLKGKNKGPERSALLHYDAAPQAAGDTFMGTLKVDGTIVAVSQPLTTQAELAAWCDTTGLVTLEGADGTVLVAAGTVPLTGGTDGTLPAADPDSLPDGLDCLSKTLGPGQVSAPGRSSVADHGAILAHCALTDRVAILDGARSDGPVELTSAASVLRGAQEDRYGSLWGPWAVIPGVAGGTSRVIPWSPIQAALCAQVDKGGNPNQAAAGRWGAPSWISGLDQEFTEDECEALLYEGVDTARTVYGQVQAYAFRTLVDPDGPRADWVEFNHARLNMAIVAMCAAGGQDYVFSQIDGRGRLLAAFAGMCTGVCLNFYNKDALFGDTAADAFIVNAGPNVNPPDQLAQRIIKSVLQVKMSPHAELVRIEIVKQAITVTLV